VSMLLTLSLLLRLFAAFMVFPCCCCQAGGWGEDEDDEDYGPGGGGEAGAHGLQVCGFVWESACVRMCTCLQFQTLAACYTVHAALIVRKKPVC
jgi:hypothetical protein